MSGLDLGPGYSSATAITTATNMLPYALAGAGWNAVRRDIACKPFTWVRQ